MVYFKRPGFALLEVLLLVTAVFLLTGITVLAINPGEKLGDKNNIQRRVDARAILDAVYQYSADHNGALPKTITASSTEICKSNINCSGLINLSMLTTDQKYLNSLPLDPTANSNNGTDYYISLSASGTVTVSAPRADKGEVISISR